MKILNKVEASTTPRLDMMQVIKKMQIDLDRMYDELQTYGEADELASMCKSISFMNQLQLKLDTYCGGEL